MRMGLRTAYGAMGDGGADGGIGSLLDIYIYIYSTSLCAKWWKCTQDQIQISAFDFLITVHVTDNKTKYKQPPTPKIP